MIKHSIFLIELSKHKQKFVNLFYKYMTQSWFECHSDLQMIKFYILLVSISAIFYFVNMHFLLHIFSLLGFIDRSQKLHSHIYRSQKLHSDRLSAGGSRPASSDSVVGQNRVF